jgi:hypothetical protein
MSEENSTTQHKFFCTQCNYSTDFESHYNRHLSGSKHINGKRKERSDKNKVRVEEKTTHTCTICNITYDHITNFKCHNLNNHSTVEDREKEFPYYCKVCDLGSFSKSKFEKHCETKIHINKTNSNQINSN